MFIADGEALVLEYRAIKCLKQGEADPRVAPAAKAFANLTIRYLLDGMRYEEARNVEKKLLDNNLE